MSLEDNKAVVRRFLSELLVKGDVSVVDQLLDPNYKNGMTGQNRDEFKQFVTLMPKAIPDIRIELQDLVAEGDVVVARFDLSGTYTGSVMGSKPSGQAFCTHGLTYYRLSHGKIIEDDPITNQDLMQLLNIPIPAMQQQHQEQHK
jgi:predicted ester cyclase